MISPAEELVREYLDRLRLRQFLDLDGVEDVALQKPGEIWVRRGTWERYDVPEADLPTLEEFAIVSGSLRHQEHGTHKPILDAELPNGERLHVNSFPTVPLGSISLTIRKHEDKVAPPELIPSRYITEGWNRYTERSGKDLSELLAIYDAGDPVAFAKACVRTRQNVILAGHTGSSKTTLLKTIVSVIHHSRRTITIEDALELIIQQPNNVRLLFRRDDLAENAIGPETLLQAGMRMHPDIIILGEMRGPEAFTFVHDVVPSHPGSVCTIHANSPSSAFRRMIGLCKGTRAGASYDDHSLATLVASAVDVIIPLEEIGGKFHWHPVWFVGDAHRRGKTALDLLEMH